MVYDESLDRVFAVDHAVEAREIGGAVEGFVRGRRFVHPKLGFTFTAPEGFTLDNTAQAVLGIKRGGSEAVRLDVVRVPTEQTLGAYLTSGWIENIDPATVEDITINGFPGATAAAKGDQ